MTVGAKTPALSCRTLERRRKTTKPPEHGTVGWEPPRLILRKLRKLRVSSDCRPPSAASTTASVHCAATCVLPSPEARPRPIQVAGDPFLGKAPKSKSRTNTSALRLTRACRAHERGCERRRRKTQKLVAAAFGLGWTKA